MHVQFCGHYVAFKLGLLTFRLAHTHSLFVCVVICVPACYNGAALQILPSSSSPNYPRLSLACLFCRFSAGSLMLSVKPYGESISEIAAVSVLPGQH